MNRTFVAKIFKLESADLREGSKLLLFFLMNKSVYFFQYLVYLNSKIIMSILNERIVPKCLFIQFSICPVSSNSEFIFSSSISKMSHDPMGHFSKLLNFLKRNSLWNTIVLLAKNGYQYIPNGVLKI